MTAPLRIGIDLGGTKTEVVALQARDLLGSELPPPRFRRRVPTPGNDYEATVALVIGLAHAAAAACSGAPIAAIGLGTPGARSRATGLMKNSNSTALNARPLFADVAAGLPAPLVMANDANCFALAEARFGAGHGARVVAGVILGTGMGGGIVIDGRALEGREGIAGEWGHVALDPRGPTCYCGRRGCLETYLSGPGMARRFTASSGSSLTADQIWEAAATPGHPLHAPAVAATEDYLEWFGRGIATILNVLDPDMVVLGGGLSQVERLYVEGPPRVAAHLFSDRLATPISRPALGDAAGVFGAALLAAAPGLIASA
jgi:fructokinase